MPLTQLAPSLWCVERPLRFLGVPLRTRMTVLRFGSDLWLHSPVAPDEALCEALDGLGRVRWVVAPNRLHHLYVGPWIERGAEALGAPGLAAKRPDLAFAGVLDDDGPWPELDQHVVRSFPLSNEVVFLHRPSRTLILTDLAYNLSPDNPLLTRCAMAALGGYPGFRITVLERVLMRRAEAREDLARILSWDFDRVVVGHDTVLEHGGREALHAAYGWLGLAPTGHT